MPTGSSIANNTRKPLSSNKRLLGLLTVFSFIIGGLVVGYIYHIKANERNFREVKLQRLDGFFDLIDRQLNNKVQIFNATASKKQDTLSAEQKLWKDAHQIATDFSLGEKEFDHYILTIKNLMANQEADSIIYKSCLKGSQIPRIC